MEEAIEEEKLFLVAFEHKEMGNRRLHNNMVADILATKAEMLHGEIEYRQGNFAKAFADLRTAVEMEDALPYDEPWGIMQPCRHALGALLLEQNLVNEAIEVYLADMASGRHPGKSMGATRIVELLRAKTNECGRGKGEGTASETAGEVWRVLESYTLQLLLCGDADCIIETEIK